MNLILFKVIFWASLFLVFYTYIGYGILLFGLIKIKRLFIPKIKITKIEGNQIPEVTFVVAAYNEEDWIIDKIKNCLDLDYPKEKIHFLIVTDGSNDQTSSLIDTYPFPESVNWSHYHQPVRRGKIAAVERIMAFVKSPVTIFTDANTIVNTEAIYKIVGHYKDPKVGAVSGEKRISIAKKDAANAVGEGFYWKYESTLKKWDAELYSVVGAAGELFSIRTNLYQPVPKDSIIEDFVMTLSIAKQGYRIAYEPEAYAIERSSASVKEELKRKIRIAAGGIQAIIRLSPLLNIFKYGTLSFQYISHRVLRWTITPLALPLLFISNFFLAFSGNRSYLILLVAQICFYLLAFIGYVLEKQKLKFKAFFIPYYFCVMNYAVYRGFIRFFGGKQSVIWEKAKRAS